MKKSNLISELIEKQVQQPMQIRPVTFNSDLNALEVEFVDMNITACSCYQSCGSNFSRNGQCSCYTSCGSNYSR